MDTDPKPIKRVVESHHDEDLNKIDRAEIKFLQYVTLLQRKYRYDRQMAKDEIVRHVAEYETNVRANAVTIQ